MATTVGWHGERSGDRPERSGVDTRRSGHPAPDVAATCCATFVDTWIRLGLTHACIAPGSRSTPMALALAARPELSVSIHHDERSAAFAALGVGLASGRPAIVLTTSGTAAVHLHAAVVEADLARVPLLALTADRPPELQGVGRAADDRPARSLRPFGARLHRCRRARRCRRATSGDRPRRARSTVA